MRSLLSAHPHCPGVRSQSGSRFDGLGRAAVARWREAKRGDDGLAMLMVIMVLVLISAVTLTLFQVTANNHISARQSQQAGASLNAADAGISQALSYIRQNGVADLNDCSPSCSSNPYGNQNSPATVAIPGAAGQQYQVWIEVISPFPANQPGVYKIHARGISGGPSARAATAMVAIDSYDFPIGIVANVIEGGGTADVHRASMYATGCVYRRDKIVFEGIDPVTGTPAAVHSGQIITDSNGSGRYCPSTKKPTHKTTGAPSGRYCDPANPYDMDINGGPLAGTACAAPAAVYGQTSSYMDETLLDTLFGVSPPPFTQAQLDQLRTVAISQGNYYNYAAGYSSPTDDHSVLYFDLTATDPGGRVNLNDITGWARPTNLPANSPDCPARSLLIIIEGGNAKLNANQDLFAATFLVSDDPYGHVSKANGGAQYIGSMYSNTLDLTGTADMWLDECFVQNLPPSLNEVEVYDYREIDR